MPKKKRKRRKIKVPRVSHLDTPKDRRQSVVAACAEAELKALNAFESAQTKAVRAWLKLQDVRSAAARAIKRTDRDCEPGAWDQAVNEVGKLIQKGAIGAWPKDGRRLQ